MKQQCFAVTRLSCFVPRLRSQTPIGKSRHNVSDREQCQQINIDGTILTSFSFRQPSKIPPTLHHLTNVLLRICSLQDMWSSKIVMCSCYNWQDLKVGL